ncbi:hypothetical protein D3C79_808210 [compost metagenome]
MREWNSLVASMLAARPDTPNTKLSTIKAIKTTEIRSTARVECQTKQENTSTNSTEANWLLMPSRPLRIRPEEVI